MSRNEDGEDIEGDEDEERLEGASLLRAQFWAVMRKNATLRVRGRPRGGRCNCFSGTAGFALEIFLPVIFVVLCCLPKYLAPVLHVDEQIFRDVPIGEAEFGAWYPKGTLQQLPSQKARVVLAPTVEGGSVTTDKLSALARAAAAALACDAAASIRNNRGRTNGAPRFSFALWVTRWCKLDPNLKASSFNF